MKRISLTDGAGGTAMEKLIKELIVRNISLKKVAGGVGLDALDDGAVIPLGKNNVVITTDSYTVKPIFFPGGDIGKLAVNGTLNDLAVMGAKAVALTNAIVIEEGFSTEDLELIIKSMNTALRKFNVPLVSGDTKVVEKGKIDGIVLTTTGIGLAGKVVLNSGLKPGDAIIVSGSIGDHGIAIMSEREGISFRTTLKSDCACVWPVVEKAMNAGKISAMKDPTRGGLAMTLSELAAKSKVGIIIKEEKIPIRREVKAASEMLGIDPLEVANEGKVVLGVRGNAEKVLKAIKSTEVGKRAHIIGYATKENKGRVLMKTSVGGIRIVEPPLGDPVPRVC